MLFRSGGIGLNLTSGTLENITIQNFPTLMSNSIYQTGKLYNCIFKNGLITGGAVTGCYDEIVGCIFENINYNGRMMYTSGTKRNFSKNEAKS